jgi:hypothetical protein
MNQELQKIEQVKDLVRNYFHQNAHYYIPNFVYLSDDEKTHIISIGTSIICTKHEIGYPGGSFVQAIVNNDLQGTFATADSTNINAIRFYLMMLYNMPITIIK